MLMVKYVYIYIYVCLANEKESYMGLTVEESGELTHIRENSLCRRRVEHQRNNALAGARVWILESTLAMKCDVYICI